MKLNNLIDILVALRDNGALTQDATVYVQVQGCGATDAFELEEVKITLSNNREDEEMKTNIVFVVRAKQLKLWNLGSIAQKEYGRYD